MSCCLDCTSGCAWICGVSWKSFGSTPVFHHFMGRFRGMGLCWISACKLYRSAGAQLAASFHWSPSLSRLSLLTPSFFANALTHPLHQFCRCKASGFPRTHPLQSFAKSSPLATKLSFELKFILASYLTEIWPQSKEQTFVFGLKIWALLTRSGSWLWIHLEWWAWTGGSSLSGYFGTPLWLRTFPNGS